MIETISREHMEQAIKNGGSVLFHPRNADGEVTNHYAAPIDSLDKLPNDVQLGRYTGNKDLIAQGLKEAQDRAAKAEAELADAKATLAQLAVDQTELEAETPQGAKYEDLKYMAQRKKFARDLGLTFENNITGDDLAKLVADKQAELAAQKPAE